MCLYPTIIRNKKYTPNKKNGGTIPAVKDLRVLYTPIKCSYCMECKKAKARQWQIRLQEEIKTDKNCSVITLTFSDDQYTELKNETINKIENNIKTLNYNILKNKKIIEKQEKKLYGYKLDNEIVTLATRLFLERWRKKYKKSIKHWFITELGQEKNENIHIHGIIWTKDLNEVEKIWKYGWICKGKPQYNRVSKTLTFENYVNEKTINYLTKYVHKIDFIHKYYNQIILCTPGIGKNYVNTYNATKNKFNNEKTNETYLTNSGHKINLPIYYRNKIYNEEEREQLWINTLNKYTRYVNGVKIDISKTEEIYFKNLKKAQEDNDKLGYQNKYKSWKQEEYELQRRELLQNNRTKIQ